MMTILRQPDSYRVLTEEASASDVKVGFSLTNDALTVSLSAETSRVKFLTLRWNFSIREEVSILGDTWERSYGDLGFTPLSPEIIHPWYFAMRCPNATECVGVSVRPNAFVHFTVDCEGITAHCDLRAGTVGVALNGRTLDVATFLHKTYPKTVPLFDALSDFCHIMSPNPLLPKEKVYGGNNWYYAYGNSSYEEIVSDATLQKILAEGLENRPFMVIDDGWQPKPCQGPWVANERYRDMKEVADTFKAMGVRPGIWIRPLCDDSPEIPNEWRFQNYNNRLDPSHPEVLKHLASLVRTIVGWGYELIKHDFSAFDIFGAWGFQRKHYFTDGNWSFYDTTRTSAEIYKTFLKTLLDATDGKAYILGCNCVSHLTAGLCHINRTGDDTSGTDWNRTRKMGVNTLAFRLCQNNAFYMVDADCAGFIKGNIPFSRNKKWVELLAKSGTPLFISAPNGVFDEEELAFMKKMYKIASLQENVAIPVDFTYNMTPALWTIDGVSYDFDWFE